MKYENCIADDYKYTVQECDATTDA